MGILELDQLGREGIQMFDVHRTPFLDGKVPPLRAPARLQHPAQHAVDGEPGVPEAGVGVVHCPSACAGPGCCLILGVSGS
jgi:hypothetical protein